MSENEHVGTESLREQAVTILKKRRDFRTHVMVYVLFNGAITGLWWATGPHGFFWPAFVMVFWGIGLFMNGWDVYVAHEPSEESIQHEMDRLRGR